MTKLILVNHDEYQEFPIEEMQKRATDFYQQMKTRRTVRDFSDKAVPREIIEDCIQTAGTAPNGANLQPWHFVVVESKEVKRQIREGAEAEEKKFYAGKAPEAWIDALEHLGTDDQKPFLEIAPYLIVIMAESYSLNLNGDKVKNYYVSESVGIATGLLIAAIHNAGLVSLTHTPSPMKFLNDILHRPINEKPFLILTVGYPSKGVQVPKIAKKELIEISTFV
jgi:iodotyrosine deiodinase